MILMYNIIMHQSFIYSVFLEVDNSSKYHYINGSVFFESVNFTVNALVGLHVFVSVLEIILKVRVIIWSINMFYFLELEFKQEIMRFHFMNA